MSPRLATSETHRVGPTAGTATAPRPTIPYGRQTIDEEDIAAVVEALRAPAITTGPRVQQFEEAFAAAVGTAHAVAVSSGTAALHAALYAVGVGPADEVIVPPMTFAASANAAVFLGATPVFADVDPGTLLLDPEKAAAEQVSSVIARAVLGQPVSAVQHAAISSK